MATPKRGCETTVPCLQTGPCFGRSCFDYRRCTVLATIYCEDQQCPFQKPDRHITDGKYYPYNMSYVTTSSKEWTKRHSPLDDTPTSEKLFEQMDTVARAVDDMENMTPAERAEYIRTKYPSEVV